MNCSMTGRKWRYKRAAGGARAPPCPFPAVCPCEAGCADFPAMWQPCPTQAPETALSRPVRRVCGEGWKMPDRRNEGRMGKRKRCGIKSGGRAAPPLMPHRPAMRVGDGVPDGGTISASGVRFAPAWPKLPAVSGFSRVPSGGAAQNRRNGGSSCPEKKSSLPCELCRRLSSS